MTELLCPAAWDGMVDEVIELLPQITPFGVNKLSKKGQTALYCAARQGHLLCLVELLNYDGIEIDKALPDGGTALHAAGFQGHEEATALLLYKGANPNLTNSKGVSARCEAKGHAVNAFMILENEGKEGLQKKYPTISKLNCGGREGSPGKPKTPRENRETPRENKEAPKEQNKEGKSGRPVLANPLPNSVVKKPKLVRERSQGLASNKPSSLQLIGTTYVQNRDQDIQPLSKIFSQFDKLLVFFIASYTTGASCQKLLDSLVVVKSLLQQLGLPVVLIGSGTWETSVPFFKSYPMFLNSYQDPSLASFELFGCKKSSNLISAVFILGNKKNGEYDILWETKEETIVLSEILAAGGATAEQSQKFGFLDLPRTKKPEEHDKIVKMASKIPRQMKNIRLEAPGIKVSLDEEKEGEEEEIRTSRGKLTSRKRTDDISPRKTGRKEEKLPEKDDDVFKLIDKFL